MFTRRFAARVLTRVHAVSDNPCWDRSPPGMGERVSLNSGGPVGLIVDIEGDSLVIAYSHGTEHALPSACFHRFN